MAAPEEAAAVDERRRGRHVHPGGVTLLEQHAGRRAVDRCLDESHGPLRPVERHDQERVAAGGPCETGHVLRCGRAEVDPRRLPALDGDHADAHARVAATGARVANAGASIRDGTLEDVDAFLVELDVGHVPGVGRDPGAARQPQLLRHDPVERPVAESLASIPGQPSRLAPARGHGPYVVVPRERDPRTAGSNLDVGHRRGRAAGECPRRPVAPGRPDEVTVDHRHEPLAPGIGHPPRSPRATDAANAAPRLRDEIGEGPPVESSRDRLRRGRVQLEQHAAAVGAGLSAQQGPGGVPAPVGQGPDESPAVKDVVQGESGRRLLGPRPGRENQPEEKCGAKEAGEAPPEDSEGRAGRGPSPGAVLC